MSVYKRQIYQIAESNPIESKLFLAELECSTYWTTSLLLLLVVLVVVVVMFWVA